MKHSFKTFLAAGAVALTCSAASAATLNCTTTGGQGKSNATFTLSNATGAACFGGNDKNTVNSTFLMFGMTGWIGSDANNNGFGDGTVEFTSIDAPVNGDKFGSWTIDSLAGLSKIVIVLKAGNKFGAFLLDLVALDPLSGFWTSTKGLSHATIYYNGTPVPPPSAVPLPAAGWMLLAGLGGIAALRRRRKA